METHRLESAPHCLVPPRFCGVEASPALPVPLVCNYTYSYSTTEFCCQSRSCGKGLRVRQRVYHLHQTSDTFVVFTLLPPGCVLFREGTSLSLPVPFCRCLGLSRVRTVRVRAHFSLSSVTALRWSAGHKALCFPLLSSCWRLDLVNAMGSPLPLS